jgi:hypothetical protein
MSYTTSAVSDRPISLSANECLTFANFEVSGQLNFEWMIIETLLSITSPHLEEVRFTLDGSREYADEHVD